MGERPCTVRKYASTLKTSAILVASLVGLWLGIIGQVSASTESEKITVQPIPSWEDCIADDEDGFVYWKWNPIISKYEDRVRLNNGYTLDQFKTDMNGVLTSPELINCPHQLGTNYSIGHTIAHIAAMWASVEAAKWAVSKGIDLTIKGTKGLLNRTAYDVAIYLANDRSTTAEQSAKYNRVAQILKPPPAAATKSCAEVDGQTPPANEYCIVAENLQSSIETELSQELRRLLRVDYRYNTDKSLSGTALYPGYKATITFTCASGVQDCGPAYVPGDRWSDNFLKLVKRTFGLSVKCSDSGNLLDVDSIEPGESVSVTHSSDTERSSPWYRNCEAISGEPFTLSIKTTRLAQ